MPDFDLQVTMSEGQISKFEGLELKNPKLMCLNIMWLVVCDCMCVYVFVFFVYLCVCVFVFFCIYVYVFVSLAKHS